MKQRFSLLFVIAVLIALSSCMTVYDVSSLNRQRLLRLELGMERSEVHAIMESGTRSIFQSRYPLPVPERNKQDGDDFSLAFHNTFLTITNPYKTKDLAINGVLYTVDYYVVGHIEKGSEVATADLIPLVFEFQGYDREIRASEEHVSSSMKKKDILVGWGWDFLNQLY